MASSSAQAQARWELENNIIASDDAIYRYDADRHKAACEGRPWTKDPHHFKNVRVSAIALLKMVMHCQSGVPNEVMGVMQGKIEGDTFFVMDSFPLPVEGTETRVNAASEANEFMVDFVSTAERVGRSENVVGWYHSHPGYGCWLSGIDVSTQALNQRYQEPFLAIVIDPTRTMAAGKVELGAFRTYPDNYTPPADSSSSWQHVPMDRIEDFGVHAKKYYTLAVSYFKSTLDTHLLELLWNKYWINTLSSSPLIANREYFTNQLKDIAQKLDQVETAKLSQQYVLPQRRKGDSQIAKVSKDACHHSIEQAQALMGQVIKQHLFNAERAPEPADAMVEG